MEFRLFLPRPRLSFDSDRDAAKQLLAALPDIAGTVRDNRSFIGRVVRFLAITHGISAATPRTTRTGWSSA